MFGIIASGRLVQSFEQLGETHFLTTVQDADTINDIVVFMTGTVSFPQGMGGLVYLNWPDLNASPTWQLLGHITEDKPSAIFKISNFKQESSETKSMESNMTTSGEQSSLCAQIGISVETMEYVQQQSALLTDQMTSSLEEFSQKILSNFFNYVSSFEITQLPMTSNPNEALIPVSVLQSWYTNFERRLKQYPNFWHN